MLKIIRSLQELDFAQLMEVYEEGNKENGADFYPQMSTAEQLMQAEQDFYAYLREGFFSEQGAFYVAWAPEGRYVSALRLEPYRDGLLLEALETAPKARRRGHASRLIQAVLSYLEIHGSVKVYSHVSKKNLISLAVHNACGFERIFEYAVYADGSVLQSSCTLCYHSGIQRSNLTEERK